MGTSGGIRLRWKGSEWYMVDLKIVAFLISVLLADFVEKDIANFGALPAYKFTHFKSSEFYISSQQFISTCISAFQPFNEDRKMQNSRNIMYIGPPKV
ncbi:hypothetical protein QJS04_geneDACA000517 [Acorus gramineus]|uniref:Uncharacterized protein n=1 Tax=Acorus gramineus TaxID=55184 RepID=A0AAV9AQR9_ACOGR|nr:hypothetical protein QJS04_geneDACA000517 [Acorus gramineus]